MRYTISTDSITVTIEADSADEAARKFALCEKIVGVENERDLVRHFDSAGGWCNVNDTTHLEAKRTSADV